MSVRKTKDPEKAASEEEEKGYPERKEAAT